ncbi:MAG: hypothetical protein U9P14_04935 [Gemmatimonadota bacterium]|nr:hypothetical protein [Gemmatimonadota bacterium]
MAAAIKTISDALITRLASQVEGLSPQTVATFSGSLEEFTQQGRNVPFAGVALEEAAYDGLSSDNSIAEEYLSFSLHVLAEDFRGRGYSIENSYGLIDEIRDCLMGQTLGLEGLAPISISAVKRDEVSAEHGLAVYIMKIETWQVRGPS